MNLKFDINFRRLRRGLWEKLEGGKKRRKLYNSLIISQIKEIILKCNSEYPLRKTVNTWCMGFNVCRKVYHRI